MGHSQGPSFFIGGPNNPKNKVTGHVSFYDVGGFIYGEPELDGPGEKFFGSLNFADDSTITIHACNVGDQKPLLKAIAEMTGATVIASSGKVQADWVDSIEGDGLAQPTYEKPKGEEFKDVIVKPK